MMRNATIKPVFAALASFFVVAASVIIYTAIDIGGMGDEEIILLPDDFVGFVTIVFDQSDGFAEEYSGAYRIYRIPRSGMLKTQFSPNKGWHEFATAYYYEKIEDANRLTSASLPLQQDSNTICVFGWKSGTMSSSNQQYRYEQFVVGYSSQADSLLDEMGKFDPTTLIDNISN